MKTVQTPDACFDGLHEYPFSPHYAEVPDLDGGSLRVHYVDEGPPDTPAIVFIHGNPSWSYAWRNVIPVSSKLATERSPSIWWDLDARTNPPR